MDKKMKIMGSAGVVMAGVLLCTGYLTADPGGFEMCNPEHRLERPRGLPMYDSGHHPRHRMHKPGFDAPHHHRGPDIWREIARLDLSQEQREQVQKLLDEKRKTSDEQKRGQRETHQALHQAMIAQPYDAEAVRRLAEAEGAAHTTRILARAETRQQVRALLTDEQRAQLDNPRTAPKCVDVID